MNVNSSVFSILWKNMYILTCIFLIGCSESYHSIAPIYSIHDHHYQQIDTYPINIKLNIMNKILSTKQHISIRNRKFNVNNSINHTIISTSKDVKYNLINYNRNYKNILKGSYKDKTYTIKKGDTLFYIAWITGKNYHDLAQYNNIKKYQNLHIGQIININNNTNNKLVLIDNLANKKNINNTYQLNDTKISSINDKNLRKKLLKINKSLVSNKKLKIKKNSTSNNKISNSINNWIWPAKGKIISPFSNIQGGNKGIDIAGFKGQPIFATTSGKVVYSGNALRGYGNLIIIKHNNDYLSAYAHIDTILVNEQQKVKAGEKIATMGNSDTNLVKLHFEIRYQGKSVNPLNYLSKK
ncbi:Murein hydrolase activator NlpD precursor [Candidatus Arsenophonus lipoptenae]|uniref:Murein hydrolase activator NlpD n=1 Tax=Candidatus Arsenophonus lipoptenae TaxID=634113 RepID=A0A0X9VIG0_9GAMM|nr:murein hydrolase activator NlpD [Candidatus Arsenophonus lipoptenae]AMA64750.1 Murein hydrolase activator NlpD precursor [Candidatus Arsenophonus lipoptenae]